MPHELRSIPRSCNRPARRGHLAIHLDLDLGFGYRLNAYDLDNHPTISARIHGINAPELATQAGKDALAYAQTLLHPGDRVTILSHGYDKYGGRFNATITMPNGQDYGAAMIQAGHAIPYLP